VRSSVRAASGTRLRARAAKARELSAEGEADGAQRTRAALEPESMGAQAARESVAVAMLNARTALRRGPVTRDGRRDTRPAEAPLLASLMTWHP
jgi:hypothetical protein